MDCGVATSKTILLFLSLVFCTAGGVLAWVGARVIQSYDTFEGLIQDKQMLIPAVTIICISVVMLIFGLVGCCSTLRESKFGLSLVSICVYNRKCSGSINQNLEHSMNDTFSKYTGEEDAATKAVDVLQKQLQCCGVLNYTSWTSTTWFASHNNSVPISCCRSNVSQCTGRLDQPNLIYTEGCEVKLERFLQDALTYAMLVVLGFAIIKFFGMLSVCVITCKSKSRRNGYQPLYA
uniref:Tetraspanin n=1 Tax=Oryzias latipes TaxID=8090 RepID=A0A3P9HKX6_ORYLA